MRNQTLIILFLLLSSWAVGQNITVKGSVKSQADKEALIGVNVLVKGTTTGTITDIDGNFEIPNVNPNAILQFTYVGYGNKEVAVNGQSTVEVMLETSTLLDEIVVTEFGIVKEREH